MKGSSTISNDSLHGLLHTAMTIARILATKELTPSENKILGEAVSMLDASFQQWLKDNPKYEKIYEKRKNQ